MKSVKNFFYREKIQLQFQKWGYFGKKKIKITMGENHFFETSFIISSEKNKFANLAVLRKTFYIERNSNFKFQNRGYFEKKNQNPHR